jgi:hypothetical protein
MPFTTSVAFNYTMDGIVHRRRIREGVILPTISLSSSIVDILLFPYWIREGIVRRLLHSGFSLLMIDLRIVTAF